MKDLCPPGWPRPKGYSNAMAARGRIIVTAGVVGWNERQEFVDKTLAGQYAQTLRNIVAILACDGAEAFRIVVRSGGGRGTHRPSSSTATFGRTGGSAPAMCFSSLRR